MNNEQILNSISNILGILNQISVTGIQNCTYLGTACAELEKIGQSLYDNIQREKETNQEQEG